MKRIIGNVLNIADASRQGILNRAAFAAKVPLLMACINALGGVFAKQKLLVAIAAGMLLLSTCFSPWAGNGNLTITWGNSGGGRWIDPSNLPNYDYTVTLRGPGGTIEKKFAKGVPSGSFNVVPGTWNVTVKGYVIKGNQGYEYLELSVMGIEQIEVKPGQGNRETIALYNAVEINEWGELVIEIGSFSGLNPGQSGMVLINKDLVAGSDPVCPPDGVPVIIVAERDITISRSSGNSYPFFNCDSSFGEKLTLTLGRKGMNGTLTLDGQLRGEISPQGSEQPAVSINSDQAVGDDCTLNMYDGVTIKGNRYLDHGCGVIIKCNAVFNMYGGTITGNDVGVYFDSQGGSPKFVKTGGKVSGNTNGNYSNGVWTD